MDGGYPYFLYYAFLRHLGFDRDDQCCIGNIEVWGKGLDIVTFNVESSTITGNRMPDLVGYTGKEMADFLLFIKNFQPAHAPKN